MRKFSETAICLLEELVYDEYISSIDEAYKKFVEMNTETALRVFIDESQHENFIDKNGKIDKNWLINVISDSYLVVSEDDCLVIELL